MPEGHVIHGLARELNRHFAGKAVAVSSPQGRFAQEAALFDGRILDRATAFGKHLFLVFDAPVAAADPQAAAQETPGDPAAPTVIYIHLGLIGTFRIEPAHPPVGQVRLRLTEADSPTTVADLRGPQWCRIIHPTEMDRIVSRGADPLLAPPPADPEVGEGPLSHQVATRAAEDYHGRHRMPPGTIEHVSSSAPGGACRPEQVEEVLATARRSRRSVGTLLMDQKLFPGVGNIYRAEVLFRAGIDPHTPGNQLSAQQWRWIWDDLVVLMHAGMRVGHIDTVRPAHTPEAMHRPRREDDHGGEVYVYRRAGQPCHVCGATIASAVMQGRNLFWCPSCQG